MRVMSTIIAKNLTTFGKEPYLSYVAKYIWLKFVW